MPDFANIRDEHYLPAFEAGMREQLREIRSITVADDVPTFANTMVALEQSGRLLQRVSASFFAKVSADGNDATVHLEEMLAPLLAAHSDAILLDAALFRRVKTLHTQLETLHLDAQSRYLIERYFDEFTMAGADLDESGKESLRAVNARLSELATRFEKNLLADTNDLAVHVSHGATLDGLQPGEAAAAAAAAAERGLGGYLLSLVLPTSQPALASLTDRALRQRLLSASRSRGGRGNEWDTTDLVLEITHVRAQRAALLGFDTHAAWVIAGQTAKTPGAVASLLSSLAGPAALNARAEQADLEAEAGHPIEAHDWAFWTEALRRVRFNVDEAAMKPYFEAERVLVDGVFYAATMLYGITFTERGDLVGYHPDVRVFEVRNDDDTSVGLYLLDLYTRDSKRGGAWMDALSSQSDLTGDPVIVMNNLNVVKPADGAPTLLSYDEVNTLFHEFGHALHGLFARVAYPKFAGTNTFRDFVEFPSQVNEMWMLWPAVLENYAFHHETGEPMPTTFVAGMRASDSFNEGYATSEYLAAAILDQAWHAIDAGTQITDVARFEAGALDAAGLANPAVPPRYGSAYFAHIMSNSAYDAGYYSYIWSEVLDADTVEWFTENGGLTRENGDRFRTLLLGVGGSKDPLEAYRDFRGRDADIQPLLTRRGLGGNAG